MNHWMIEKTERLGLDAYLSARRRANRPFVLTLLLLALFLPVGVYAAISPGGQMFQSNSDFELGNMTGWTWQGSGWGGVENCCGQHNTPFWGTGTNPYPAWPGVFAANSWDGSVSPAAGGDTQLYRYAGVTQGQKYRLSSWLETSGLTGYLRRWSPSSGTIDCGSTTATAHTPLSCEFTAGATESVAFILEQGYGAAGQWADSDDWALTPITTAARCADCDVWAGLPVSFWVDATGYPARTDVAYWKWNNAMGKPTLQRISDSTQPNIIKVIGQYLPGNDWAGATDKRKNGQGQKTIILNKYWMDPWNSSTYRYGFEARESTIAHEFGHALGLDEIYGNCEQMSIPSQARNFDCAVFNPTTGDVAGLKAIYP